MSYERALRYLAFLTILPAAAPVYFFAFWRWFSFWRRHPLLTYTMMGLTFIAVALPVYVWRRHVFAPRFDFPVWVHVIGWVLLVVSNVFGFWADRQLGFRVRSFTPHFDPPDRIRLLTTGAYGIVRHPIYSAGIFFGLGSFLVTGYVAVLAAWMFFTLGALWFTRREEERTMALLDDPTEYERYRRRVPALFPRPWPRDREGS